MTPGPIESLQWFYGVILALAVTEALSQFAKETCDSSTASPPSQKIWRRCFDPGRVPALISVIVLVVPFFHGMNLYLSQTYVNADRGLLLLDIGVFTIEAAVIFLLSRQMRRSQWREFYFLYGVILLLDAMWGWGVYFAHGAPTMWWAGINTVTFPILWLVIRRGRKWTFAWALLCAVVVVRTFLDYWLNWNWYFPK
ncbi:MAG: hypothetical protein WD749_05750 [Phycisphaerales bacterium]